MYLFQTLTYLLMSTPTNPYLSVSQNRQLQAHVRNELKLAKVRKQFFIYSHADTVSLLNQISKAAVDLDIQIEHVGQISVPEHLLAELQELNPKVPFKVILSPVKSIVDDTLPLPLINATECRYCKETIPLPVTIEECPRCKAGICSNHTLKLPVPDLDPLPVIVNVLNVQDAPVKQKSLEELQKELDASPVKPKATRKPSTKKVK